MPAASETVGIDGADPGRRAGDQNGLHLARMTTSFIICILNGIHYHHSQWCQVSGGADEGEQGEGAQHRMRIMEAAAKLFRQRGFEAVTVAEMMKAAGLTVGAFYGHFPSKEALIAASVGSALPKAPEPATQRQHSADFADGYLSVRHRNNLAGACLFSSRNRAARGWTDLRHEMTEAVRRRIEHLSVDAAGDRPEDQGSLSAIAAWSAMVGAMVLARLVNDDELSKEILAKTRAALPLIA